MHKNREFLLKPLLYWANNTSESGTLGGLYTNLSISSTKNDAKDAKDGSYPIDFPYLSAFNYNKKTLKFVKETFKMTGKMLLFVRHTKLYSLLFIWGLLSSCNPSNTPAQKLAPYAFSKINCYVRYMEQTRELQGEITFRTDSTKAIKGAVLLNDEAMLFKKLPQVGLQYRLNKRGQAFDWDYTFSFTDRDQQQKELGIQLNKFENLRFASEGMSIEKGALLEWDGEPLEKEDGLVLIFSDSKGNTFSINHSGVSKGKQFQILGEHSSRLEAGPASLQVTRKRTLLTEKDGQVKMLTIELYTKPLQFEIKA